MTKNLIVRVMTALVASVAVVSASAEDIDIFSSATSSPGAPNVLLIVDNSANWNTRYADEKAALAAVVGALRTQFNLGLMFYNESTDPGKGAYVRFAIQPMTDANGNATNARNCLLKMMGVTTSPACVTTNAAYSNLDRVADKANAGYIGLAMAEAYAYFAGISGASPYNGANAGKGDPLAFVNGTRAGPQYLAPDQGDGCVKNFIIHISNGGQESTTTDNSGKALLTAAFGAPAAVTLNPPNDTNPADEWARALNKSSLAVVSYAMEVDPVTNGQGPTYTKLMQSIGTQGKGGYFAAADAPTIQTQLGRIFNDIQAVNSVFASSSLPLSADNSGAYANQVYMGVFRPDGQGRPRWLGNIKQYQFAADLNGNLSLVDALGLPAAGAAGFAQPDAVSFWTSKDTSKAPDATTALATTAANGSTGGFWFFDSRGSGGPYDSADGEWVEKGGAAQQLRLAYLGYGGRGGIGDTNASTLNSKPARKVYTCTGGGCTNGAALSTMPFDSTNAALTTGALGATSAAELTLMLKWIRGQDTQNENGFQVAAANTDVRASIHGDVLHSRPVVLNFGTPSTTDNVYIFYGGNDGMFRAIKGGQAATDGAEQWAFIPQEFFGKLKRLYSNSPQVLYPSTSGGITPTPVKRDYFFDGPVGSYVERNGTGGTVSKAILFISMRRGGRLIYALDVTAPTNPKFLWVKSSSDAGFSELGQTWSQPKIAKIAGRTNPVLIFGAGYDANSEDSDTPAATDSVGRAIYMIDAFTGAPIWAAASSTQTGVPNTTVKAGMNFSFAADVVVIDRSFDGNADRIYATDVGGNVWRVDIGDVSPSNWAVWKLAGLADRTAQASTRKFLFGTEVVLGDRYDAVFVGSGDREHPLASNTATQGVTNRFYMLKDRAGSTGADLGLHDTCGATFDSSCTDLADANANGGAVPADAKGWSIKFATGEKVVNGPLVVAGHILFGTNQPDTSGLTCTANLGIARRYDITFDVASTQIGIDSDIAPGGGFLPPVVAGIVEIGGQKYLFTTDNPLSPGGPNIKPNVSGKRARTFWRSISN